MEQARAPAVFSVRDEPWRNAMSDPRYTDPRYTDPRLSDPVLRREDRVGGMWGWIAGLAVVALVVFLLVAGYSNNHTAGNNPTSSTATRQITPPPSTTGQGSHTAVPLTPAPQKPPGTQ
jgi:hypothetical protein